MTAVPFPQATSQSITYMIAGERPGHWSGSPIHDRAGQPARMLFAGTTRERENHNRKAAWLHRLRRLSTPDPLPGEPT